MPNSKFKVDPKKYREKCAKDGTLRAIRQAFKKQVRKYQSKIARRKTKIRQQLIKESRKDRVKILLEEARQAALKARHEIARLQRYDMRINPEKYRNEETNDTDEKQENRDLQSSV